MRYRLRHNPHRRPNPVNGTILKPTSPGWWVTETKCSACGRTYENHRAGVGNDDALNLVRSAAKADGDEGGGFRSRGPMLWAKRVLKLSHWYETHYQCGQGLPENRRDGLLYLRHSMNEARRERLAEAADRRSRALDEVVVYTEDPTLGF
jgi:hypothetical protein